MLIINILYSEKFSLIVRESLCFFITTRTIITAATILYLLHIRAHLWIKSFYPLCHLLQNTAFT